MWHNLQKPDVMANTSILFIQQSIIIYSKTYWLNQSDNLAMVAPVCKTCVCTKEYLIIMWKVKISFVL